MIKYSPSQKYTDEGRLLAAIIKAGFFPRLEYSIEGKWYVEIRVNGRMLGYGEKRTRRAAIIAAIKHTNKYLGGA